MNNPDSIIRPFHDRYVLYFKKFLSTNPKSLELEIEEITTKLFWKLKLDEDCVATFTKFEAVDIDHLAKVLTRVGERRHGETAYTSDLTRSDDDKKITWTIACLNREQKVNFQLEFEQQPQDPLKRLEAMIKDLQQENKELKEVIKRQKVYSVVGTDHSTTSETFVPIPNSELKITLEEKILPVSIVVTAHMHSAAHDGVRRADAGIFLKDPDGKESQVLVSKAHTFSGTGLSHTPTWVPMTAIGQIIIDKPGDYTFFLQGRNAANNGQVNFHSCGLIVQVL